MRSDNLFFSDFGFRFRKKAFPSFIHPQIVEFSLLNPT